VGGPETSEDVPRVSGSVSGGVSSVSGTAGNAKRPETRPRSLAGRGFSCVSGSWGDLATFPGDRPTFPGDRPTFPAEIPCSNSRVESPKDLEESSRIREASLQVGPPNLGEQKKQPVASPRSQAGPHRPRRTPPRPPASALPESPDAALPQLRCQACSQEPVAFDPSGLGWCSIHAPAELLAP